MVGTDRRDYPLLRGAIAGMRAAQPRLRAVLHYQGHDQRPSGTTSEREHYYGARRVG